MNIGAKIAIIILILLVIGISVWYFLLRIPKIVVSNINKISKTATIKIGDKSIQYKLDKSNSVEIPNVSSNLNASIVPNTGSQNSATIELRSKDGKLKHTHTINFD